MCAASSGRCDLSLTGKFIARQRVFELPVPHVFPEILFEKSQKSLKVATSMVCKWAKLFSCCRRVLQKWLKLIYGMRFSTRFSSMFRHRWNHHHKIDQWQVVYPWFSLHTNVVHYLDAYTCTGFRMIQSNALFEKVVKWLMNRLFTTMESVKGQKTLQPMALRFDSDLIIMQNW